MILKCSPELDGNSIDTELLLTVDLANQLVGILTRFKENNLAFIAGIEKYIFRHLLQSNTDVSCNFICVKLTTRQRNQLTMKGVSTFSEVCCSKPRIDMFLKKRPWKIEKILGKKLLKLWKMTSMLTICLIPW